MIKSEEKDKTVETNTHNKTYNTYKEIKANKQPGHHQNWEYEPSTPIRLASSAFKGTATELLI